MFGHFWRICPFISQLNESEKETAKSTHNVLMNMSKFPFSEDLAPGTFSKIDILYNFIHFDSNSINNRNNLLSFDIKYFNDNFHYH